MKIKYIAAAITAAFSLASAPAFAGAAASAWINITGLGFVNSSTGIPIAASNFSITNESRTASDGANYNGTSVGNSFTDGSGLTNVPYACVGSCASLTPVPYSPLENNTTYTLTTPVYNYALGDAVISGNIGATLSGLTRGDASSTGGTNIGGSSGTLLNGGSASLTGTFTSGATVSAKLGLSGATWIDVYTDLAGNKTALAASGYGWDITIKCTVGANCGTFASTSNKFKWSPDEVNDTENSTNGLGNFSAGGAISVLQSDAYTYTQGYTYQFTINQSSNANIVTTAVPEPSALALAGLGLFVVAGATSRRRAKQAAASSIAA